MKAAIYARMSTDKQNEASPADQVAGIAGRIAATRGWEAPGPPRGDGSGQPP